jgi:hypothetical protein
VERQRRGTHLPSTKTNCFRWLNITTEMECENPVWHG